MYDYDLIVIGGGLGGYGAAIRAAQKGRKVLLIEKNKIGGVCLNVGCIPTKALLKSAHVYEQAKNSDNFGIKLENVSYNWESIIRYKNSIVSKLVKGVEFLLKKNKVVVEKGEAFFEDNHTVSIGDKNFTGENILVAVGSKPAVPKSFETFNSDKIIFSDKVFEFDKIPSSITIVGGGVIGIEIASVLGSFGTDVKVIEIMDEILPGIDKEITSNLKRILKKKGITIYTSTGVKNIIEVDGRLKITAEKENGQIEIESEYLLIATGRVANTCALRLENTDIRTETRGFIRVDDFLRAGENIYAVGDVIGGKLLAHKALHEGLIAVENMFGGKMEKIDDTLIPAVIYTTPEIATVGFSEEKGRDMFGDLSIGKFPLVANGKSLIEGESSGFMKVIFHENKLIGASLMSSSAGEMIQGLAYMIKKEARYEDLKELVFPHPTVSESIGEAFMNAFKEAIHIMN